LKNKNKMKKLKLLFLSIIFPAMIFSQGGVELVPFAGYMFGGSIKFIEGKLNIEDGMDYGLSILVPVQTLIDVELNWTRMDSKATFTPYAGYPLLEYNEAKLATNYFQIGVLSKFYSRETMASPFVSLSLGATWFDPSPTENTTSNGSFQDVWRFSVAFGLGVKIMFSERIGIILRGRLLMPMTFGGTSFYFGTGGSGLAVNTWVTPLQGDFNGGLIIRVGGN
jgi:hypothetical protein